MVTVTPMRPSSSMVVVTSFRCGTLPIVTGPSASSAPARIGSVAFLAPEMRTSPSSGDAARDLQFIHAPRLPVARTAAPPILAA